ncbi:7778_t:CDS:2 [Entrophospora sp. SA101]|nr:7778_t:CDS:2 [Entrophospora sp. SA101]
MNVNNESKIYESCVEELKDEDDEEIKFDPNRIAIQASSESGPAEAGIFLSMGEWMELFFMDLKYDGLYCTWLFLRTILVIEKASIPLAEFAISHVIALEEHIGKLAENYKYWNSQNIQKNQNDQTTPPRSFMHKFPNTPQVKLLLK